MHIKEFQLEMLAVVCSTALLWFGKIDTNLWWTTLGMCLAAVAGSRVPKAYSNDPPPSEPSIPNSSTPPVESKAKPKLPLDGGAAGFLLPTALFFMESIKHFLNTKS